jgi:hypothetical protein
MRFWHGLSKKLKNVFAAALNGKIRATKSACLEIIKTDANADYYSLWTLRGMTRGGALLNTAPFANC